MFLFLEIVCAYFAAVGLFFLLREAYFYISGKKEANGENEFVTLYIARNEETENEAHQILDNEDYGGRIFVIYGNDKQIEKKIAALAEKQGKLYIKK